MYNFLVLLKKEFLEFRRTNKVLILLIVMLFIGFSSPIIAKLIPDILSQIPMNGIEITIPDPTWRDSVDQFIKNLGQFGIVVLIFLFAGAIVEEKQKKTFEILLTKPVARTSILVAKYVAAILFVGSMFVISIASFAFYTQTLFSGLPVGRFIILSATLFLFFVFVIVTTVLLSTVARSYVVALGLSFAIFLVGTPLLGLIERIKKFLPDFVLSNYQEYLESGKFDLLLPSIVSTCILIGLMVIVSLLAFRMQEIER